MKLTDTFGRAVGLRFCLPALLAGLISSTASGQTTVMFQHGVDGYAGSADVFIGLDDPEVPGGGDGNVDGSTIEEFFLDGRYFAERGDIQELQVLLQFADVIGNAAGQVPAGSQITNAVLTLHGGVSSGNAESGGPYGVAQLLVPFDTSTTWNDLVDGATFGGGDNDRPADNGFRGPLDPDTPAEADVTSIVQNWANGATNHGLVVRSGTTNGWQVFTTGAADATKRPKLTVSYDAPSALPEVSVALQNGVGGYSGTTMAWLQQNDTTTDGTTLDAAFLDGSDGGTSPDDLALIRFDNIFASQGGPVPDGATITEAQLLVDTADGTVSANVGTNGNFAAHQMLVDWDLSSVYSGFGTNGPDEAEGETGPALDLTGAMIADARASFDVTDAVRAWQSGSSNFGLAVKAFDTSDGWAINWLGSASAPQLVVTFVPEPGTVALLGIACVAALACVGRRKSG